MGTVRGMVPTKPKGIRQPRRSFADIRFDLLQAISTSRSTVNDLSKRTDINWKTVDNHLIYLCGRGWAEKVYDSPNIKIFDITQEGSENLEKTIRRKELALKKTSQASTQRGFSGMPRGPSLSAALRGE